MSDKLFCEHEMFAVSCETCARDNTITRLRAEVERLRAALEAWDAAVRIDVLMEGPRYMGIEPSRGRQAWELTRAALTFKQEET